MKPGQGSSLICTNTHEMARKDTEGSHASESQFKPPAVGWSREHMPGARVDVNIDVIHQLSLSTPSFILPQGLFQSLEPQNTYS